MLDPLDFPKSLYPNTVNANPEILKFYVESIVPNITKHTSDRVAAEKNSKGLGGDPNDDGNYGSAATLDVEILQAISKRIHYGMFACVLSLWCILRWRQANLWQKPNSFRIRLLLFPIY